MAYNQIFPQVQPVDIGNTLRTVVALKGAETQNRLLGVREAELNRTVADRNALRAALPGALNGDADASAEVAAINPELWMKLDANKKAKIKQDLETTGRLLYSVEQSADKPAAYQAARAQAQTLGLDISKVPEQYDPNWVRSNIAAATSLSDQIKLSEGSTKVVGNQLIRTQGGNVEVLHTAPDTQLQEVYDASSPTSSRLVPRSQAAGMPGKPPAKTLQITGYDEQGRPLLEIGGRQGSPAQGGVAPTKAVETELQKSLVSTEDTLGRVSTIAQRYKPEYLTYQGGLQAFISRVKDKANFKLDDAEKEFLKGRKKFAMLVDRDFNAYRKEITGAAAAEKELEDLKKATINTDLGPAEFEAAMETYQGELMRGLRLKRRLVREGIPVGDPRFGKSFDQQFTAGGDDSPDARGDEIKAANPKLSDAEVLARLRTEGYQ